MKYRKKPIVVEAHQWFRNGDHPEDLCEPMTFDGVCDWTEGKVVRYFRRPDISGNTMCGHCDKMFHVHGWIDTLEGGHIVCPGDWIITGIKGEYYPCKPDIFAESYENVIDEADKETGGPCRIAVANSRNRRILEAQDALKEIE
jgi:hypothetical protein